MSVATDIRNCTTLAEVEPQAVKKITVQRWQNEGLTIMSDLQSIAYYLHVHRDKRCEWRDSYDALCSTKSDTAYISFQVFGK